MSEVRDAFHILFAHAKGAAVTPEDQVSMYDAAAKIAAALAKVSGANSDHSSLEQLSESAARQADRIRTMIAGQIDFESLLNTEEGEQSR